MKKQTTLPKKDNRKKIILTAVAVGATGILGYFGWRYYKKKKESKSNDLEEVLKNSTAIPTMPTTPVYNNYPDTPRVVATPKIKTAPAYTYTPKVEPVIHNDEFPLKKGSRGEKVKALQEALVEKYGKKILPRYGADGQFGAEMATALKKSGLPASVDESTYNVLVKTRTTSKENLGLQIYNAAIAKDFNKVITLLKKLKNKDDYSSTSESFKNYRINGVRQTLVNGLLNSFTSEDQKQKIRFEFIRMGLQYDGNKWSLSGLDGLPLMTTMPTTVWLNAYKGVKVPAKMVLGNEVSKRLDYTLFENQGKYFLVATNATTYLKN